MQTLRKLDDYFIGTDEGTAGDRVWFYGTYAIIALCAITPFL